MESMNSDEIRELIAAQALVAAQSVAGAQSGALPKMVPIFHGETGKPPPTPGGVVYRLDAVEWCARSGYVMTPAEVKRPESEPKSESAGVGFPGSSHDMQDQELKNLQSKFEKVTGKPPHHNLGREKLLAGIAAAE